uniref:Uncharacterized protein n=1 Tax=Globisporangium ultimum (strain ATCC 200006 / CBS 805.95 / DAOM BR144) TaxID=431595 RepID=K3XBA2_GLOUD
MGKKRHAGGNSKQRPGGSNGGGSGAGLMVVNPALMQSMAASSRSNSSNQKKQQPKQQKKQQPKKRAIDADDHSSGSAKKKSKNSRSHGRDTTSGNSRKPFKKKDPMISASVASVLTSAALFGATEGQKRPISLMVSKEEHLLAGVYWIALTRAVKRNFVVVVPNNHATLTPQTVASAFRNLGFQALSLHKKMTLGQRKENIERLTKSSSDTESHDALQQLVLVTPEHFAPSAVCANADVLLLGVKSHESYSKFAVIFQVLTSGDVTSYRPEMNSMLLQQVQARLKIAFQITEIAQRLGQASGQDVDSKWANKLAKDADLGNDDDDDDDNDEDEDGNSKRKKGKKKALSPDEQRLQALTQKLVLLVARKLEDPSAKKKGGAALQQQRTSDSTVTTQDGKEKLELLGLVTLNAAVGASLSGDERLSAQTQWMDAASGKQFGGTWSGCVRHGASKDASSLALRKKFIAIAQFNNKDQSLLGQWKPNKNPADLDKWGGAYGKVCGHNEVVMHSLRPFYPQEVLNSRVCSKVFPAPGNQGFDGCLEHLRLECLAKRTPMTLWDAESFIYISGDGRVTWTKKNQLLGLSLAGLQCLMTAMRTWTLSCEGRIAPKTIVEAIQMCCQLGNGDLRPSTPSSNALEVKLLKRIMSFALGGSVRLWKQITKVPRPLEDEIVYT